MRSQMHSQRSMAFDHRLPRPIKQRNIQRLMQDHDNLIHLLVRPNFTNCIQDVLLRRGKEVIRIVACRQLHWQHLSPSGPLDQSISVNPSEVVRT